MTHVTKQCEVCGGEGNYPIIDMHGTERYSIRCPECFGSGTEIDEVATAKAEAAEQGLPPASTAASIKDVDHLRFYIEKHWR
jgi:DnaJ-class molecular chaperone